MCHEELDQTTERQPRSQNPQGCLIEGGTSSVPDYHCLEGTLLSINNYLDSIKISDQPG